jgi:hypothetical protein
MQKVSPVLALIDRAVDVDSKDDMDGRLYRG